MLTAPDFTAPFFDQLLVYNRDFSLAGLYNGKTYLTKMDYGVSYKLKV